MPRCWPRSCRHRRVSPDGHFFDDLGATRWSWPSSAPASGSGPDLPPVSMKDIYQHPTIAALGRGARAGPEP